MKTIINKDKNTKANPTSYASKAEKRFALKSLPDSSVYLVIFLIIITFISYLPVLSAGFVWDDTAAIHENLFLQIPGGFFKIWTTHGQIPNESHYWPLVYTTYYIEYKIAGLNPFIYHFTNLLLHIANSVLVFLILLKMKMPGEKLLSAFTAAVFALHPVHVESVAWIIERKDVLSGFFYLLAFLFYLDFENAGKKKYFAFSLSIFICALLSKSVAVTLPAAILLWQRLSNKKFDFKKSLITIPYFIIGFVYSIIDVMLNKAQDKADFGLSLLEKTLIASKAVCFYFLKFIAPFKLMTIYPRWEINPHQALLYIFPLLITAALFLLWIFRRKISLLPIICVSYFIITLSPMLGFIDFTFMEHSFVADRFQYLAGIGLCVLFPVILYQIVNKMIQKSGNALRSKLQGAQIFIFCFILVILGILTWKQSSTYKDIKALFTYNLKYNSGSYLVHNNLAAVYIKEENFEKAKYHLNEALKIKPEYSEANNNIGMIYSMEGNIKETCKHYLTAYKNGAPWSSMINDLAWYMATSTDPEIRNTKEALRIAKQASDKTRNMNPGILDTLAAAFAAEGNFPEAVKTAEQALLLSKKTNNPALSAAIQKRLELYRNCKMYKE